MWNIPMVSAGRDTTSPKYSRLLVGNDLNSDVATRKKYANLVDSVKDSGGTVHIFSSLHVSGEQLATITGIAAILRFPLPDLEDIEM
uniref:eRF1 domain-containing protein n=1 Tax=Quercus lobata TaxID=97700 RepID=A0A7N2LQ89_QUELO